jgi:hypothetical protein
MFSVDSIRFGYILICQSNLNFLVCAVINLGAEDDAPSPVEGLMFFDCNRI